MNDGMKEKVVAVRLNPGYIDKISGYAKEFQQANVEQEKLKKSTGFSSASITLSRKSPGVSGFSITFRGNRWIF